MKTINIIIAGVGGQGTLLTSKIIGQTALNAGYDVKVSEVHGMSQRGGSVVTYARMGDKIDSPIVEKGQADIILAFEELEAMRWLDYLRDDGHIIVNSQKINPMPVIIGNAKYPSGIEEYIQQKNSNSIIVDALGIAKICGNFKTLNVIMIGIMAKRLDVEKKYWLAAIDSVVPKKFLDVNIDAFNAGYSL
jgi:indolepyruvate ferredoxin oxidoreductase beta subunit